VPAILALAYDVADYLSENSPPFYYHSDYYYTYNYNQYFYGSANQSNANYSAEANNNQYEVVKKWLKAKNGHVPVHAILYKKQDGKANYYCRAKFNKHMYYGLLIPKDGCYITDKVVTMRFESYQVLVQLS
jgi:hypothetical protein